MVIGGGGGGHGYLGAVRPDGHLLMGSLRPPSYRPVQDKIVTAHTQAYVRTRGTQLLQVCVCVCVCVCV